MRKKVIAGVIVVLLFYVLFSRTGFLQKSRIDAKDLSHWRLGSEGIIEKAGAFTLNGTSGNCWVMVHGYTSTADELRVVAEAVNAEYNDTVYVLLLPGHGKLPSNLQKYTYIDWYTEVKASIQQHNCTYLLGSSTGASLVLRYAEEQSPAGIVLASLPLKIKPAWIPTEIVARILKPIIGYIKRKEPGETIQEPTGRKSHITGYSVPLSGVLELIQLNKHVEKEVNKVRTKVLMLHAVDDTVADIRTARRVFERINAEKKFVEVPGGHIIFEDYGKEKAVQEIIKFRRNN